MEYTRPDVYAKEADLSQIVSSSASSIGVVVGASERGPVNTRVQLSNTKDFAVLFGQPNAAYG